MTDGELLNQYARDNSQSAFEELVRRHINLVYSASLRQTLNPASAEDITQAVFTDLAGKAGKLACHPSIAGWLFTSVRFTASAARRNQQRREQRELEAMQIVMQSQEPQPDWAQIRPLLDNTLCALDPDDREAILLRYFEDRSYGEIGQKLGSSENTARMRVQRALGRLHAELSRRGVASTEAALAIALAANGAMAAPNGLAQKVSQASMAEAGAGAGIAAMARLFLSKAAVLAILAVIGGLYLAKMFTTPAGTGNANSIAATIDRTNNASTHQDTPAKAAGSNAVVAAVPHHPKWTNGLALHLTIVTADSGKAIPSVPLDVRGWQGEKFFSDAVVSDRLGRCYVTYPPDATELELTTRKEGFADTQLLWHPGPGHAVPAEYLLKLDRGVTIGGQVLDPEGNPIAGATVGFNHEDRPETLTTPQNHRFGWVTAKTDATGHWSMTRIADDMIRDIYGSAEHDDFQGSSMVFARDRDAEKQLRAGQIILQLAKARTVQGVVLDESGAPVSGAKVFIGQRGMSGSRHGKTGNSGKFSIKGCRIDDRLVTASMPGYAATTIETNLDATVELTLKRGKTIRLHVVDADGNPVARVWLAYAGMSHSRPIDPMRQDPQSYAPQAAFEGRTDAEGNLVWKDAPIADLNFAVEAVGYYRSECAVKTNEVEKTITLVPSVIVYGTVSDATTGQLIPKFRIAEGWPEWDPINNTTNPLWSTLGRFWSDYTGGIFSNHLDEAVMGGEDNKGYFLKFVADGYAPFVSRLIRPDEGMVQVDALLQPASSLEVTVLGPDGKPEGAVDVGLVSKGARLDLRSGGFSWQNIQAPESLLKTDRQGQFKLQPDSTITRVIAASPDGYAESSPANLTGSPVMQLQPWGNLTITCQSNGVPVTGAQYRIGLTNEDLETVSFELFSPQTTDSQGKATFVKVPPGHQQLTHVWVTKLEKVTSMRGGESVFVDIPPGGTAELTVEDRAEPGGGPANP